MPQLIVLAIAGAGLYAGYKWVSRKAATALAEAERARSESRQRAAETDGGPRNLGQLEWDPASGVYTPRRTKG